MNDYEWMTGVAAEVRGRAEAAWLPDTGAIEAGGRRLRRLRRVAIGGGVAGTLAVTVAVAVGLGAVGGPASTQPATPLSTSVFSYADLRVESTEPVPPKTLPVSMVDAMSQLIDTLDPDHAHLRQTRSPGAYTTVPDGGSAAKAVKAVIAASVYTTDGTLPQRGVKTPSGSLQIIVAADGEHLGRSAGTKPDVSVYNLPCGYRLHTAFEATSTHDAHWSACKSSRLPDGSKVDSSTTPDGTGMMTVAIREFPNDAGGVVLIWTGYPGGSSSGLSPAGSPDQAPDPAEVLAPDPFGEQQLTAALAGPGLGPFGASAPAAAPDTPKQFLTTGDLGPDAVYYPSDGGSTGDLPMDNGCDYKDVRPLARPGRTADYRVTTPGGENVAVGELEYPLASGTGPATMATARSQAAGGCDQHGRRFSQDSVQTLPAGIGDEAFVENGVGPGAVTVWLRFHDTILRIDVMGDGAVPDLSALADHDWLVSLARHAAARWTAQH